MSPSLPAKAKAAARRWLPWVATVALFAWLLHRVPLAEVRAAMQQGPYLLLAAYVLLEYAVTLPADTFATRQALALVGIRRDFRELFVARGATYLLGLLSYFASLGGIGFWVAKGGVRASRATGAVLLMMVSNGLAVLLIAACALLADLPPDRRDLFLLLVVGAFAGTAAYLGILTARWPWLTRRAFLAPLFEAGVAGHLKAVAARVPHMLLLAMLHWGAFRVWGIGVPFFQGIVLTEAVLLITALPVTPSGLGTTQVLQVLFFSAWAHGATPEERAADVLAFSLAHWALSLAWQAALGAGFLAWLRRLDSTEPAEAEAGG